LAHDVDTEAVTDALREQTADVAGFAFDVKQFLNERIEELIGGTGADLVIRLRGLELPSLEQAAAALSERVAAVRGVSGLHEDGVRTILFRLDARGRALDAVARDVGRAVAETPFPAGVYAEVGGEYAAAAAARQRLLGLGALALLGIFVLLVLDFRSARLAALTM